MTTTKEALEPPDRIWIDPKDQSFWNDNGDVSGLIEYSRVSVPIAPVVDDTLCLLCGHKGVAPDGTCMAPVQICSDDYHGTRRCGCKCKFKAAPASTVAPQQLDDTYCSKCGHHKSNLDAEGRCSFGYTYHRNPKDWCGHRCVYQNAVISAPASPAALRDKAAPSDVDDLLFRLAAGSCEHLTALSVSRAGCFRSTHDPAATTPPSTLAKAAVDEIVKGWFWHLPERDQNRARINIEQIIERYFSAEGVDKDNNEGLQR